MTSNRRDFIKFIVAGSVAGGCPLELALRADASSREPAVEGESNEICHQVRDGYRFDRPPVSARHDVIIAGGGVSGLSAAHLLDAYDFLVLEKEPHWGGNAYLETYEGQAFATGSAFIDGSETLAVGLARELGLKLLPVDNPDGTILRGKFIPDTWRGGLDHLPYTASVRDSFRKFRRDALAVSLNGHERELDNQAFSKFFRGYAPEVKAWWDVYGPSNWGARTEETSALVGLREMRYIAAEGAPDGRITWPGGLGAITQRLAERLQARHRDQMRLGATLVAVEQDNHEVRVTYVDKGRLITTAAKAVIMALPKFMALRLIASLPARQRTAMQKLRYIPYPVVNLVFNKPVFNQGYDTWCPGNTFTDFVVADWTVRNEPGYRQKVNILTCYTPLKEDQRVLLMTEEGSREVAAKVLGDFQRLFPGSDVDPVEVTIFRRGHPLYMSVPGNFTEVQPLTRLPFGRIFFANTDSEGPVSTTSQSIAAAHRAVGEAEQFLAGGSSQGAGRNVLRRVPAADGDPGGQESTDSFI